MRLLLLVILAAAATTGCATNPTSNPSSSASRPSFPPPETPSANDLPETLGDALLVEATSGTFKALSERTSFVPARVTVWDSGLVTANIAPLFEPAEYQSIQLTDEDFAALRQRLLHAQLTTYIAQDVTGQPLACADCNVQIIRTDISGTVIEMAIGGYAGAGFDYPEGVKLASHEVASLLERFQTGQGAPWRGDPPLVQVSEPAAGG